MPAELVQECVGKGSALIRQSVSQMANDYFLGNHSPAPGPLLV